jgi:hypothetical protein
MGKHIIGMIAMHRQQNGKEEESGNGTGKKGLFGNLRRIDDDQIKINMHYIELVSLQRKAMADIDTPRFGDTERELRSKEAQFYNDLADQHEKFARNGAMLSYINGGIASMDAGLITYSIAFGGNALGIAAAGIALVLATTLAAFSVHSKRLNKRLAAERRDRAKRLMEEGSGQGMMIDADAD